MVEDEDGGEFLRLGWDREIERSVGLIGEYGCFIFDGWVYHVDMLLPLRPFPPFSVGWSWGCEDDDEAEDVDVDVDEDADENMYSTDNHTTQL